jgi:DNA-binding IclR family transcriptional regulator
MMRIGREARQEKQVLEALATVGESGMTPLALAVTTQLPEQRLQVILQRLCESGNITRLSERYSTGARISRQRYRIVLPR